MNINDKITLKIKKEKQFESFNFQDQEIIVKTHIDRHDKVELYTNYYEIFFDLNSNAIVKYLTAKYSFILGIISLCTNIEIKEIDLDDIIASGLWDTIVLHITNYSAVTKDLYGFTKMVSEERSVEKSVGNIIDNIYESIKKFISEFDEEQLKHYMEQLADSMDNLRNNGVILPNEELQLKAANKE